MFADALLAWMHYLAIITLCGCVVAEVVFYRPLLERAILARLARVDLAYGILAAVVIATGIARVVFSPKGSAFYLHNAIFWTKMGLFLAVALLSIPPTVHYVRLGKQVGADGFARIERGAFVRIRAFLFAESALLAAIPLCAALMARGFGWSG